MIVHADILVVCGLRKEAAIAAGHGVATLAGGGRRRVLQAALDAVDPARVAAVVSFGIAGALDPALRVGDVVVPRAVRTPGGESWPASPVLRRAWLAAVPEVKDAMLVGVDCPAMGPADRAALRSRTGAGLVDMESHLAAGWAARHGLPFGALRIISDGAERTLPPAAAAAMRPDGGIDLGAVLRSLLRQPGQIPVLVATAREAAAAFRQLRRVRGLLGPRLGLHL